MSRVPSNAEQFMGGMQMGAQNLQGARENWAIKQQDLRARQGLDLERQKMAQQGQQFRMGLQAEAENYRKLNESRERMQQAEMAQQGAQFNQRMEFDKEQARIDRAISVKMAQIQNEREMNEKAIQALAKNDPRVAQLREKRRQLQAEADNLQNMGAAAMSGLQALTQQGGVYDDKFQDISGRLAAYSEALAKRREMADAAMLKGFDHAMTKGVMNEGYWAQVERVGTQQALRSGQQIQRGPNGELPGAYVYPEGVLQLLGETLRRFFGSTGDPALAEAQASEFMKNPKAMSVSVIENAIDLNRDAFGLEPGEAKNAATVAGEIVAKAALLSEYGTTMGPEVANAMRDEMAKGVGKLRKLGMDDTQISAIFESLENIGSNRTELMTKYVESGDKAQFDLLDRTLSGMAEVGDQVQAVLIDSKRMQPVGGIVHDLSRFDMQGALKRGRMAVEYAGDPEVDAFMQDIQTMRSMGLLDAQGEAQIREILTSMPPEVTTLNRREAQRRVQEIAARQQAAGREATALSETERDMLESVIAESQYFGGQDTAARLAELAQIAGGRP